MKFNSEDEFKREETVVDPDPDDKVDEVDEEDTDEEDMNDLWEDCIFPAEDTEEEA